MNYQKTKIKVGDTVMIVKGKDAPKSGKIVSVSPKASKAIVEALNQYKKHIKPSKKYPQGGIVDMSQPIEISNLRIVCPSCKKAARVSFKNSGREKRRICKKCNEVIDAVKR